MPEQVYDNEFADNEPEPVDPFEATVPAPRDTTNVGVIDILFKRPKPGYWISTRPNEVGAGVHMICARCGTDEIHARLKNRAGGRFIDGYAAFYREHMKCEEK